MSEIEFRFLGWNNTNGSDKIWGWFTIGEKVYNFWGPRGEKKLVKLSFKQFPSQSFNHNISSARSKQQEKLRKGYKSISVAVEDNMLVDVERIYPGFTDHLKKQMLIAKLSGIAYRAH